MADDLNKQVLVQIDIANQDAQSAMQQLQQDAKNAATEIKNLKAAVAAAKAATSEANAEYAKERVATQKSRTEYQQKRTAILEANQALKQSKQATEAAVGSYDAAQKQLTALGRAIKSAEGGFTSSNPAIQQQIAQYNTLNAQLKKFDAQLGNHQRNVGNYSSVLSGLNGVLGKIAPGFTQFNTILQSATSSFNGMTASETAAVSGTEALGGSIAGVVAGIAAAITVVVAFGAALAKITPNAERLERVSSGLSNVWTQFVANFQDEHLDDNFDKFKQKWADFFSSLGMAYKEGSALKQQFQDLARSAGILEVANAKADAAIADLQLKMRNRRNTPEQEQDYFNQIQAIASQSYEQRKKIADAEYELAVRSAVAGRNFTADEIQQLREKGIAYAAYLDKIHGLANQNGAGSSLAAIQKAQEAQTSAERFKETTEDRAQNRLDARQMKADAEAEKAKQELEEAIRAGEQLANERQAALVKMAQDQMDAFGKELSTVDEHYRQLIFKQQEFIRKQQELSAKSKSPAAKAQYALNISSAEGLIDTYKQGADADRERLVTDYYKKVAEQVQKGEDEIVKLRISAMRNVLQQQLANVDEQETIAAQEYKKQHDDLSEQLAMVKAQYNQAQGDEKSALKEHYSQLTNLLSNAQDIWLGKINAFEKQKAEIQKAYNDRQTELNDQVAVFQAKRADKSGTNSADKALLDAEQKALLDKYNAEVSNERLTNAEKLVLEQQYLDASQALNDEYRRKEMQKAMQWAGLIQNAAFDIIKNAMASEFEYKMAAMNREKTFELNNASLTNTQRAAIEEKYRVQEGKAKQKQFKQEQALAITKTIINTAEAVMKTFAELGPIAGAAAEPFIIAEGALELAAIAAQKPPAYATGGVHVGNGPVSGPGTGTSDSVNARLSNGESVINAKSTAIFGPLLSAINEYGGGVAFASTRGKQAFASGGVIGSYLPTPDNGLRQALPVAARMHSEDLNALGAVISNAVMNMPNPVVDVKDINYQQQVKATVLDRVTH